ncbi:hypothetical protein QBC38DRAFT_485488 [Podospora fimiseda]|uniref:Uncharacterized protein n=1 Tax=Podospora fimiseda TaxID=252190 RepID=A0AAN7BJJ4_9PEZI|nr:hypothetical protein QBC38DRAFT_485488 [Podospora fimiseda]
MAPPRPCEPSWTPSSPPKSLPTSVKVVQQLNAGTPTELLPIMPVVDKVEVKERFREIHYIEQYWEDNFYRLTLEHTKAQEQNRQPRPCPKFTNIQIAMLLLRNSRYLHHLQTVDISTKLEPVLEYLLIIPCFLKRLVFSTGNENACQRLVPSENISEDKRKTLDGIIGFSACKLFFHVRINTVECLAQRRAFQRHYFGEQLDGQEEEDVKCLVCPVIVKVIALAGGNEELEAFGDEPKYLMRTKTLEYIFEGFWEEFKSFLWKTAEIRKQENLRKKLREERREKEWQ